MRKVIGLGLASLIAGFGCVGGPTKAPLTKEGTVSAKPSPRKVGGSASPAASTASRAPSPTPKPSPTGPSVSTYAGGGPTGDDGLDKGSFAEGRTTSARFNFPHGLALGDDGSLYVADSFNHRIRRIAPDGTVSTFAGGKPGSDDGMAAEATFATPWDVAIGPDEALYVSTLKTVRRIAPDGLVTTVAGPLNGIVGRMAIGRDGTIYLCNTEANKLHRITPAGAVANLKGAGADGTPIDVTFDNLSSVAIDAAGTLYLTSHKGAIATVAPGGLPVPFNVKAPFSRLDDIAVATDGSLVVAEFQGRICRVATDGTVTTLAGSQTAGYLDGKALGAKFDCPTDVAVAEDGRVFVSDTHNHRIRLIQP
jgi:sugar lactone lactonase YvrE